MISADEGQFGHLAVYYVAVSQAPDDECVMQSIGAHGKSRGRAIEEATIFLPCPPPPPPGRDSVADHLRQPLVPPHTSVACEAHLGGHGVRFDVLLLLYGPHGMRCYDTLVCTDGLRTVSGTYTHRIPYHTGCTASPTGKPYTRTHPHIRTTHTHTHTHTNTQCGQTEQQNNCLSVFCLVRPHACVSAASSPNNKYRS